jgi:hypothetical protein
MIREMLLTSIFFAGAASAETITRATESCTGTNICFQVPNDAGVAVDFISNAVQYRRLVISIDGDIFDSGLGALAPAPNTPPNTTTTYLETATIYDPNGNSLTVSLNWTIQTTACSRSGRVTVCPRYVTLTRGTLVR